MRPIGDAVATVSPERGRWWVDITVPFPDGVVYHRIADYHTAHRARIAAGLIERAANRSRV